MFMAFLVGPLSVKGECLKLFSLLCSSSRMFRRCGPRPVAWVLRGDAAVSRHGMALSQGGARGGELANKRPLRMRGGELAAKGSPPSARRRARRQGLPSDCPAALFDNQDEARPPPRGALGWGARPSLPRLRK